MQLQGLIQIGGESCARRRSTVGRFLALNLNCTRNFSLESFLKNF
jgi:hypothetical protein